jgi:hypothetical protein
MCDSDCTLAECGDNFVNAAAGEACDGGPDGSDVCNADCTESMCGDGIVNAAAGEACDGGPDGSEVCNSDCTASACGDGFVNAAAGEACDEGGVESAVCNIDCTASVCGDSIVNAAADEVCDEGVMNVDLEALMMGAGGEVTNKCTTDCEQLYFYSGAMSLAGWSTFTATIEGYDATLPEWAIYQSNNINPGNPMFWTNLPGGGTPGVQVLRSPSVDLGEAPMEQDILLRFRHQWGYLYCPSEGDENFDDGGNVKVEVLGGGMPSVLNMDENYAMKPITKGSICPGVFAGNPKEGEPGYGDRVQGVEPNSVEFIGAEHLLNDFRGEEINLVFEAGWDCSGDCYENKDLSVQETLGWHIDDIVVIGVPAP